MATPTVDEALWFRRFHPRPDAGTTLVCLPHAGGTASFFYGISQLLPPDVEALAVQYPGREDRRHEPQVDSVQELAGQIFGEIRLRLDRPVALLGHSMGATVGFELARLLEQQPGAGPVALFASGRPAPSQHRTRDIHRLDDAGIIEELEKVSGTDARILRNSEYLQTALPSIRGDYRAAETYEYRPGPPLRCPVVGLTGDSDIRVSADEMPAWREHTSGSFELEVFPGGHFYLTEQAPAVTAVVTDTLRRIAAR